MGGVMRSGASLWVRILAIGAAVAAPLAPPMHGASSARSVVYVVDSSASVGRSGLDSAEEIVQRAWDARGPVQIGLVAFAGQPELRLPVGGAGPLPPLALHRDGGSDLAAAVRLARAALPTAGQRRLVLLTDGRATRGDAMAEVIRAEQDGITVDTLPIGSTSIDRLALTRITPREPRVAQGQPAQIEAALRGAPEATFKVRWSRDGQEIMKTIGTLDASGSAETSITDPHPGPGIHVYRAQIIDASKGGPTFAADGSSQNTAVTVGGKPRVLVLTIDGSCPAILCDALDKADVDKQVLTLPEGMPDAAALSGADLVVLADVPLESVGTAPSGEGLTPAAQSALVDFAQKGGGVIVTGGAFGMAPEYAGTPLARMLPVEIEDKGQIEDPRVAMAIMLDRSGSMGAMVGTHTKLQLAVEAALAAAATLRADDLLALGSVDEQTHWDHPFGLVSGLAARRESIRSIEVGGGGILVFTALVDAYGALGHAPAPVRHVILFSDTADSEEQVEACLGGCDAGPRTALELAEAAHRTGITTSVVGIGRETDSDTAFLRTLAATGGGRFYRTDDGADLRRIFVSETRVAARSNLRDGPVNVRVAEDHPILAGVDLEKMPPLGGFVETKRRATAAVALVTREDDKPLLASWRYGLGQVVAITTDLRGDWNGSWSRFVGAGQVLRQMTRFAMRKHASGTADMRVTLSDHGAEATLDLAEPAGEPITAPSTLEAFAVAEDGTTRALPAGATLERVAQGRFRAHAATAGEPFVVVRARDAAGGFIGEAIGRLDGGEELATLGPDKRALEDLASAGHGLFAPDAEETLRAEGPSGREPIPVWPWVLVGSAVLVCIDLWLRRAGKSRAAMAPPALAAAAPGAKASAGAEGRGAEAVGGAEELAAKAA
jgi:Ca-activated chloride channel family protein